MKIEKAFPHRFVLEMIAVLAKVILLFSPSLSYAQNQADSSNYEIKLGEVVVSASRLPENLLKSPVSIEKVTAAQFVQSPQPSFFEALENVKGVHLVVPSLGFKVLNARGFANTTNVRFAQLVDGADNQAPHIGAAIGSALGPNDLDILSVEIVPGTASALYGMNAINGLANFQTKNPFDFQGFSFQQKMGVNHLNDEAVSAKPFYETSLRYAKAFSKKWAFKINGTFTKGYDWISNDRSDLSPNLNASAGINAADNPAYDPVSGYGNESANRRTLSLTGKNVVVARTGYFESDVANYNLQNLKADFALHFRPTKSMEWTYTYRTAFLNTVYQRSNRFWLKNYRLQQQSLQLKTPSLQARAYVTSENTGDSYNLRSISENIDRGFKSDNQWFSDFQTQFKRSTDSFANALREARSFADLGRPQPATEAFQNQINQLGNINNWDIGAALRVQAQLYHAEAQWNLTEKILRSWKNDFQIEILAGFDHRSYVVVPDGNYFINPVTANKNLVYGKTGGFLQLTKSFWQEKLKLGATIRSDKADYFSIRVNPRFTAVFSPTNEHHFRASYQNGYRFPSIFEGFSNINSGGVKRVGGLPVMSQGIFENSYLRKSIDDFQAAVNAGVNLLGQSKRDSLIRNKSSLLQKNPYTYLRPEFIRSFEIGYKGLFLNQKLLVDADFYYNRYRDFMAQVEANIPNGKNADSLAYYLIDRTKQQRYRLWTNSQTAVYNYGASVGLSYSPKKGVILAANTSYSRLDRRETNDGLEDGFNTPRWLLNVSASHAHLFKNFGFGLSYKHQSSFYYQSFLVNGEVQEVNLVDGQFSYALPAQRLHFKLGGTNLPNRPYYSILGGPQIGGFYYLTVTYSTKN